MKILPNERLEVSVLDDPKHAGLKFKINHATSIVKKAKALVIKPAKAKQIYMMAGRNHDSIPHTITVRLFDKRNKVVFETTHVIPPHSSLQYTPEEGFYVLDDKHDVITTLQLEDGEDGIDGAEGKQGRVGPQGKQGQEGPSGAVGSQGEVGKVGREGPRGPEGIQGLQGDKGDTGLKGETGTDGSDGKDGTDGQDGTDGAPGLDGVDGDSFTWKGAWTPQALYNENDTVSYLGSSYIAIAESVNRKPVATNFWNKMAEKGEQGDRGKDGEKGERGRKGGGGINTINGLPPGGANNQVLTKQSSGDFDVDWETSAGGGASRRRSSWGSWR